MRRSGLSKWLFRVIGVCALISMLSVSALAGDANERYGYRQLENETQRKIYREMRDGVAAWNDSIDISVSGLEFSWDDLSLASEMVVADHPEYFWYEGGWGGSLSADGCLTVTTAYWVDGQIVSKAQGEEAEALLKEEVAAILQSMPKTADTDYEKALFLHDALAKRVTYRRTVNDQTAYGALVDGEAVCAGYATAYQLLLHQAGIEAFTVCGFGIDTDTGTGERHAWNLVWIEEDCCYTDVTWDDQGDALFHAYFNRSLSDFEATHVPDETYENMIPVCDHEAWDYFTLNAEKGSGVGGIVTSSTPVQDVFENMKVQTADGYTCATVSICFMGDGFDTWMASFAQCTANNLNFNGYSYSRSYMGDEIQITFQSGMGGVYSVVDQDTIQLSLRYSGNGIAANTTYDLLVAYYTDDGQFIGMDVVKATLTSNYRVTVSAEYPVSFDVCRAFLMSGGSYIPVAEATEVLQK